MANYRLSIRIGEILIVEEYADVNRLLHDAIAVSKNPTVSSIRAEVVKGEFDEEKQLSGSD